MQRALAAVGGPQALAAMLDSDVSRGLSAEDDLEFRARDFGRNWMPVPDPKTWVQLFIDSFDDTTLIILIVSAVVSLAVSVAGLPCLCEPSYRKFVVIRSRVGSVGLS